jgi:hypothetical protein
MCAVLLFAALVCAQESPDGRWEGSITEKNVKIGVTLDLAKNAESEWVANIGIAPENQMGDPSVKLIGRVVQRFIVNGASVSFMAVEMMLKFDLTLGAGGTMKGTITPQQGPPISVEFKRTGEAKIVDNPFVGTWKLNVEKSKLSTPAPQSSTISTIGIENGTIFVQETVDFHGKIQQLKAMVRWDEKEGESVIPGQTAMCSRIDSNTVVIIFKKDGKETKRVTEAISNGGRTLTRTTKDKDAQGNELEDIAVFEKSLVPVAMAVDNPFVGTWKHNVGKSRPFRNPAKSDIATITIIENGLKIVRDEIAADGRATHEEQVMIFDGKEYPSVPFPGAMQTCSRIDDYGFICVLTIGGREVRKIYDLISSDGRTGTVIYTFEKSPGREGVQTFVYDKQ